MAGSKDEPGVSVQSGLGPEPGHYKQSAIIESHADLGEQEKLLEENVVY